MQGQAPRARRPAGSWPIFGPKRLKLVIFFVTSACNAKCRTCFYWNELNQRGDLTWDEIQKLSSTMPQFSDLWLSGGEPMLRKELGDIIGLFCRVNGVRWVNLPTNGLMPSRTAERVEQILTENHDLRLDLNVALDGLHSMQDSIRAVPGNFKKTVATLDAIQPARRRFPGFRVNVNTVICAENFDHILEIADFVKECCSVDGHYFNIIRGSAKEEGLKKLPFDRLPALYKQLQPYYAHYASTIPKQRSGPRRWLGEMAYQGTMALHNRIQLENIQASHPWPMPCTASETSIVIDFNGGIRGCELRENLGNVREFGCDFSEFWESQTRKDEASRIRRDQCWCTHVCFIHDSLRHSPKAMLYDVPLSFLRSKAAEWTA